MTLEHNTIHFFKGKEKNQKNPTKIPNTIPNSSKIKEVSDEKIVIHMQHIII